MANGFRQKPLPSRREQQRVVNTEIENMQTAIRMSQMMLQQLLQSNRNMADDLGQALTRINELQYKVLAVQEVSGLDINALKAKADALRLNDFNESAAKQDAQEQLTEAAVVGNDSVVTLTSTTAEGGGIFRSRIKLAESGVPALIQGLMDKPVGTKVDVDLNGVNHTIELLAIRNPPAPVVTEQPTSTETV